MRNKILEVVKRPNPSNHNAWIMSKKNVKKPSPQEMWNMASIRISKSVFNYALDIEYDCLF